MEKRKFTRVEFKVEAIITYQEQMFKARVENLSLRGMFLRTTERIPTQSNVGVRIYLSGETSELFLQMYGKVVRTELDGMALELEKMDLDSFIHLRNIITYNSEDPEKMVEEFVTFIEKHQLEGTND